MSFPNLPTPRRPTRRCHTARPGVIYILLCLACQMFSYPNLYNFLLTCRDSVANSTPPPSFIDRGSFPRRVQIHDASPDTNPYHIKIFTIKHYSYPLTIPFNHNQKCPFLHWTAPGSEHHRLGREWVTVARQCPLIPHEVSHYNCGSNPFFFYFVHIRAILSECYTYM